MDADEHFVPESCVFVSVTTYQAETTFQAKQYDGDYEMVDEVS